MGRKRKYESAAERKAAQRARQLGVRPPAPNASSPVRLRPPDSAILREVANIPKEPGVEGQTQFEGSLYETRRHFILTEQQYIARLLEDAAAEIRREPARRERIERHARWLLTGYMIGLIPANALL